MTIYGGLDVYAARYTASGREALHGLNSGFNPNTLGFAIREDLGDGLKAGAVLEMQPTLDSGTFGQGGKPFGRQSYVYLGGGWGTVNLGRIHLPGRAFGVRHAATGWLTADPSGTMLIAMGSALAPAMNVDTTGSRVSNAVSYVSPTWNGMTFTLLQSAGEGQTIATGSAKVTAAGLSYVRGPLTADFVYNKIYDIRGRQVGQDDFSIGTTYDFKAVKVYAAYWQRTGSAVATAGSTEAVEGSRGRDRLYYLGASVPVFGTDTVGVAVGRMRVADAHRGLFAANMSPPFTASVDDATSWAVSYTKPLSKRTMLFAAYSTFDNDGVGTGAMSPSARPTPGGRSAVYAAGLRHNF